MPTIETERLLIRPAIEPDRPRLIELFGDPAFMEFSSVGAHSLASANRRFDQMVSLAVRVRYAKQPVLERDSHRIVGYTGVGIVDFEGRRRLEWGWRFDALARGKGYATEATNALLAEAGKGTDGEVLCIIAQDNEASKRVAEKVGFTCWRAFDFPDDPTTYDLFVRSIGAGGAPLVDTAGGAHPDGA